MHLGLLIPSASKALAAAVSAILALIWTYLFLHLSFGWQTPTKMMIVAGYYSAGLGVGLLTAMQIGSWFLHRVKSRYVRFVVLFLIALCFVMAATAGLLAIQYRFYYSQWHEPFLTRTWMFQLFFTALGATAQYGIFGVRYHGIGGLLIIIATCWWATRTRH
ncbi:MAG: hypothetical protein AAFY99_12955 [Pseudomonadota bacterium]